MHPLQIDTCFGRLTAAHDLMQRVWGKDWTHDPALGFERYAECKNRIAACQSECLPILDAIASGEQFPAREKELAALRNFILTYPNHF